MPDRTRTSSDTSAQKKKNATRVAVICTTHHHTTPQAEGTAYISSVPLNTHRRSACGLQHATMFFLFLLTFAPPIKTRMATGPIQQQCSASFIARVQTVLLSALPHFLTFAAGKQQGQHSLTPTTANGKQTNATPTSVRDQPPMTRKELPSAQP